MGSQAHRVVFEDQLLVPDHAVENERKQFAARFGWKFRFQLLFGDAGLERVVAVVLLQDVEAQLFQPIKNRQMDVSPIVLVHHNQGLTVEHGGDGGLEGLFGQVGHQKQAGKGDALWTGHAGLMVDDAFG